MRPSDMKPLFTSMTAAGRKLLQIISSARLLATRTGRPLGDVMRVLVESRPPNRRPTDLERDALAQEANAAKDLATLRDLYTLLAKTGGAGERIRSQRQA